jgi:hypothetical protein
MQGAPQPCDEKKRLRAAYVDALEKLREATAVLQQEHYGPGFLMGRNFWTPWRKPSKPAPSMTPLGGRSKTIAKHTAASGFGSYVPF